MRETILTAGPGTKFLYDVIRDRCSQVDVLRHQELDAESADLSTVTGLVGWQFNDELVDRLPNLRWIQILSVGIQDGIVDKASARRITLTNTHGLYGDSVADYVMWALLTLSRNFQIVIRNQSKRRWRHIGGPGLNGQVLGILGVGDIGRAVATRAKSFQMRTVGIVRNSDPQEPVPDIDQQVCVDKLDSVVRELDALALCLPATPLTKNLVNAKLIAKMKPNMRLVSISRAGVLDISATVKALRRGKIAGAAIDVFDKEPLSRWSRLWGVNNLIVTPHVSAITDDYKDRVCNLVCTNIDRHCAGQALLNTVGIDKGY